MAQRITVGVAVLLLVAAAFAVAWRGTSPGDRETVSPPVASSSPVGTEAANPGPVRALLTPSGVPVVVRQPIDGGYLVGTPCEDVAVVSGTPIGPFDVVLDPGHGGGVDTGAVGRNGLVEADLNLQVAAAASLELAARGIPVLLTRNDDYAITLPTRVDLAEAVDAELLVSIHHNAPVLDPSPGPGTEVFVQSGAPESIRLGGLLQDRVVTALSAFDVAWVAAGDAGVLQVRNTEGEDAYGMVRRPPMPAVLLELGYLANPAEAELFATPAYVDAAGLAIADGVEAWLTTDETGARLRAAGRVRDPAASAATRDCVDPDLG